MMKNSTSWNKDLFNYHRGWLSYGRFFSTEEKFVARFKYSSRDRAGFQKFLVENFTPTEYFARLTAGETPVKILESKGYISATIKAMLKEGGYSIDQKGVKAMIADDIERGRAAWAMAAKNPVVTVTEATTWKADLRSNR